jgi:hypothetical protein
MPNNRVYDKYDAAFTVTCGVASLASDTNLLAGRESAEIDNGTNGYADLLLSGFITAGTSPTASRSIEIWAVASRDDTDWPDVFDGTDSAETIGSSANKQNLCKFLASIPTTNTSDQRYSFSGISVAAAFGGRLPRKFVLFVTHNTGVALNATAGNHLFRMQPIYAQIQTV